MSKVYLVKNKVVREGEDKYDVEALARTGAYLIRAYNSFEEAEKARDYYESLPLHRSYIIDIEVEDRFHREWENSLLKEGEIVKVKD